MKLNSTKILAATAASFGLAMFAACEDSIVNSLNNSSSIAKLGSDESLPDCDSTIIGKMVYSTDSAAIFYCTGGEWNRLTGKNGADGKDGENGKNGTSCSAKSIDEGIEVSCGETVIDTIVNGIDGINGANGANGLNGEKR